MQPVIGTNKNLSYGGAFGFLDNLIFISVYEYLSFGRPSADFVHNSLSNTRRRFWRQCKRAYSLRRQQRGGTLMYNINRIHSQKSLWIPKGFL